MLAIGRGCVKWRQQKGRPARVGLWARSWRLLTMLQLFWGRDVEERQQLVLVELEGRGGNPVRRRMVDEKLEAQVGVRLDWATNQHHVADAEHSSRKLGAAVEPAKQRFFVKLPLGRLARLVVQSTVVDCCFHRFRRCAQSIELAQQLLRENHIDRHRYHLIRLHCYSLRSRYGSCSLPVYVVEKLSRSASLFKERSGSYVLHTVI